MRRAWLLPLLLAACGSSHGSDGGSTSGGSSGGSSGAPLGCTPTGGSSGFPWPTLGDAGVPLESYAQEYFLAYCQAMSDCYPMSDALIGECSLALSSFDDFSFQECTAGLCGGYLVQPADDVRAETRGVQAGRLSYNADQAGACLGTRWPVACDQGQLAPTPPPGCETVFAGQVDDGGACYLDIECAGGSCVKSSGCPGYCQPGTSGPPGPSQAGDECPCAAGLTCAQDLCWAGVGSGGGCSSAFDCAPGSYCSPGRGNTCQPQVAECGVCDENLVESQNAWSGQCTPGLFCRGLASLADGGVTPGVCVSPVGEGGACEPGLTPAQFAGPVTGCLPGLDCVAGICVLPPSSGSCLNDDTPCLVGTASCFIPTGQCQSVSDSQCTMASCAPGLSCISGTCEASIPPPSCTEP
jgi:hypothetical protein